MTNIPGRNNNVEDGKDGTSMRQIKISESLIETKEIQKNKGKHDKKSNIKNRIKNKYKNKK